MAETRVDQDDPILPKRITHNCEEIWDGDNLEQHYNYLIYEFETEQHRYHARAYLDEIYKVSVHGPFAKESPSFVPLANVEIDQRVLAYLRRRYSEITRLGPAGYVPVEEPKE